MINFNQVSCSASTLIMDIASVHLHWLDPFLFVI